MPSKTDFCVRSLTQLAGSKRLFVLGAANDRKEATLPNAAPRSNGSEAQIATFAKLAPGSHDADWTGPNLLLVRRPSPQRSFPEANC